MANRKEVTVAIQARNLDVRKLAISALRTRNGSKTETPGVYIFRKNSGVWLLERTLFASDGVRNDGDDVTKVVVNNGRVVAGSFNKRSQDVGNGPVYVFTVNNETKMDC